MERVDGSGRLLDLPGQFVIVPGSAECSQAGPGTTRRVAGRCPSNTYLQSSQGVNKVYPECLINGGLDWFEWSALVDWRGSGFQSLVKVLESTKKECQEKRLAEDWVEVKNIGPVRVGRTGVNRGGSRGQQYEYRLTLDGITLGLANQSVGTELRPNLFVQQKGRACLLLGAVDAYHRIQDVVSKLGGYIAKEKLTRVDPCIDIAGLDIAILQEPVERRQFVSRARHVLPKWNAVDGRKSGFCAGKNPLYLVVYEKLEEQIGKGDALYMRALIDRRWGGVLPICATRVEYQVSRPWLVKQGIDSPADFMKSCGALVEKLTTEWFRLTTKSIDQNENHQSRADTLDIWKSIQQAFRDVYGQPTGTLKPILRSNVDPRRLVKQGIGCLTNAVLQTGKAVKTFDELIAEEVKLIYRMLPLGRIRDAFMRKYQCRRTEFQG